jgi:hypothetical protein
MVAAGENVSIELGPMLGVGSSAVVYSALDREDIAVRFRVLGFWVLGFLGFRAFRV